MNHIQEHGKVVAKTAPLLNKTRKGLLRGRTNHFSKFLADYEFLAACYLLTVSNSGLPFSHSVVTGFSKFKVTFQSIMIDS